ncbi:hypothetical protein DOM22_09595 [Bdellovibrio sp. ZAP7]|uniref:lactonase family protein n=1 Tax=Bdellovibrio sp. ZAP7 TaxID=2231053 RepID=UPI0011599196|nr:beta-propeller fold lactonase family protein [Bdellovibrio sp. ZAP7]QDK45387.1 hypothetical protein DOM22_09595 [Bdellovibrio sp. ZAP7]
MKTILGILSFLLLILSGCAPETGSKASPQMRTSRLVYILNSGDNTIGQFRLNTSGNLEALTIPTVATGSCPRMMVMDKKGEHVYVGNYCDDTISQFQVGQDGALSEIGAPVSIPALAEAMVLSPDGRFIYTTSFQDRSISRYQINTDGTLSLVGATSHPDVPLNLIFSPSGKYVYVASLAIDDITQYEVHSDGSLSLLSPATVPTQSCPSGPLGVKTVQGHDYVYVLSCAGAQIENYKIGTDGALSSQGVVTTGLFPINFAFTSMNVYTANIGDASISSYSIQVNGELQNLSQISIPAGLTPENVEVDELNNEVYILDSFSNKILRYAKNVGGTLRSEPNLVIDSGATPSRILFK